MTVSIKKMSAGDGYRYYAEAGSPPGRWMGSGVASLDSPLRVGDEVTEEQFRLLVGEGCHPVTGDHLGRKYRTFKPTEGKRRHPVAGYDFTFSIPKSASVLWNDEVPRRHFLPAVRRAGSVTHATGSWGMIEPSIIVG